MTTNASPSDEMLVELMDQLLEKSRSGEALDWNSVIQEHPHLEQELRQLWATATMADDLCQSTFQSIDDQHRQTTPNDNMGNPVPGMKIPGYMIGEMIGRGGMGIVYSARQLRPDRSVAVKMILHGAHAATEELERFRVEGEIIGRLQHPNIVPLYEIGDVDGLPYFSMPFIEGTTLAERIKEGPLSSRETAELILPICRAVAEAHRHGVLHRDLKPSNILIQQDGRPFVTDFGLSKQFQRASTNSSLQNGTSSQDEITLSGAVVGTPSYMSPEQAIGKGGKIGPAADVYSLGAILYACLTGRAPFMGSTPVDTMLMVLEQSPVPPRMVNRSVDSDLEMIVLKCLQKPTDLRYESADRLADDLQAYLNSESISAKSSHFPQVISRAFRETHHAEILENWGLLWMWHAVVLMGVCVITNIMQRMSFDSRFPYLIFWSIALGTWALTFWNLRRRSGPVTFVERQIAHVWAGALACSVLLYELEALMSLPVLTLSPVLALVAGTMFLAKAGILSGEFYIQAIVLFLTASIMPLSAVEPFNISLFGLVAGLCFFLPGLKFFRQRRQSQRMSKTA